jgi:formamidopyrimidine-DNA glycosylase
MPEIPDIVYIHKRLAAWLPGRAIAGVEVRDPIVLRLMLPGPPAEILGGHTFRTVSFRGPFFRFDLDGLSMLVNLMLSGKFQRAGDGEKPVRDLCLSLSLDDGSRLNYGDEKRMGKIYLAPPDGLAAVPGFSSQGLDILGSDFTLERFRALARSRRQARAFIMDQSALSAIGNAYADEILFRAGLHPKTPCNLLGPEQVEKLYTSIREVIAWGIFEVEKAGRPIEEKVRGHMRVRNRGGQPCPVCGTIIRRASVLGYDSFFCPRCQPAATRQFIEWQR